MCVNTQNESINIYNYSTWSLHEKPFDTKFITRVEFARLLKHIHSVHMKEQGIC